MALTACRSWRASSPTFPRAVSLQTPRRPQAPISARLGSSLFWAGSQVRRRAHWHTVLHFYHYRISNRENACAPTADAKMLQSDHAAKTRDDVPLPGTAGGDEGSAFLRLILVLLLLQPTGGRSATTPPHSWTTRPAPSDSSRCG